MEVEDEESFGIRSTLDELERENADLLEQTKNLQEENRNLKVSHLHTYFNFTFPSVDNGYW